MGGEKTVEEQADNPSYGMFSKEVQSIIYPDEGFDYDNGKERTRWNRLRLTLRCEVTDCASDNAHDDCSPWVYITRSWCSSNQCRNGPGAKANHAKFPLESVIKKTPHYTTEGRSEHRIPNCHNRAKIRAKRATAVETEPSKPEDKRAKIDHGHIMRSKVM